MRDGAYLLPNGERAREVLEEQGGEIKAAGGLVQVLSFDAESEKQNAELVALFDRTEEYAQTIGRLDGLKGELAKLAGRSGIRVNTLAPGNIIFPDGDWDKRMKSSRREAWQRWLDREVPLKRFGKPEEIGSVATFMLSPVASFLAGAMLPVDGAQSC